MAASIFQLTMRSGPTPGKVFPLEQQEILMGRDLANDISISDPEVSRRHARLLMQEDNVIIEDLGSTNGTFLNGQRIASPQQLRAGDVITLGENIVVIFDRTDFDPDATVVSSAGMDQTVQPEAPAEAPMPQPSYGVIPPQQQAAAPQSAPAQPAPAEDVAEIRSQMKPKKKGMPAWLIVLIVAIVVIACVIAVTMYFMPASWWCAITFNMLEGCPIP
jgi:pSer/pThr/pTyr-binding forkhead associated (FHA) protein